MLRNHKMISVFSGLVATAILAACGGGGGGSGINPPGGGGSTPTPTPTAALNGTMMVVTSGTNHTNARYGAAGGATVVFSCGCTTQAGTTTTDGSGNFTLVQNSPATPAAPNPTYTIVPGRNYVIVGKSSAGAEAWTMQFAGTKPSHNLSITGSTATDIFGAAVSLYVFQNASSSATAFDDWNFNALLGWYSTLKTSPNAAEVKLLDDLVTESVANHTLFPSKPGWNPPPATPNPIIWSDLASVKSSVDSTKPTPCPTPGGSFACTGTPSP